ncbi:MAG: thiamine pyrophosphate-requiring protein [Planctomycetia bacterium]|nr:thiamine pyrophosphate-requiring protein [Planctomycetia bacterium]
MKASAAIASILKTEGVEYLFCFPVNPLIDECARIGIRPIVARTERTLLNMADGYSRASNGRRIGVAAVQNGPGAENAYAGVAQAFADGSPLLFLPGGNPAVRVDLPPNFDSSRSFATVTKWGARLNAPERVPAIMRRAFTLLRSGRPGPVLVEVPVDIAATELPAFDYQPPAPLRTAADPAAVREAIRMLRNARRPLLHVGQGVLWAEAAGELRTLAEALGAAVMTTLPGKSAFPEGHPLSVGNGGYSGTAMAGQFLQQADVILGIGCSFTSTIFGAPIPAGKVIIHATNNEADVNKDVVAAQVLLADARLVLGQLIEELERQGGRKGDSLVEEIAAAKRAWIDEWKPLLTSNETPLNPYRVLHDLMQVTDRTRTIITHDSGTPRDQLAPFWETLAPRSFLGWGKSTQLGSSLGFALGAKLAEPEKLVIHFLGDTALGMCGMDLETAAREHIPILTVLVNNGTMGGYEKHIPFAGEKYRARYLTGDYSKVAEGLGVAVERVTEPAQIVPALKRAIAVTGFGSRAAEGRPALVEFITREETRLSKPW